MLIFTSCKDTPESLAEERVELLNSFGEIVTNFKNQKLSEREAIIALFDWRENYNKHKQRCDKFIKKNSVKEYQDVLAKHEDELHNAFVRVEEAHLGIDEPELMIKVLNSMLGALYELAYQKHLNQDSK